MSAIVIAIDGPAGAGKSTVSKLVAKELDLTYLDTGAMYRALAYQSVTSQVDANDGEGLAKLLDIIEISFGAGDPQRVYVNGTDVSESIRTPLMGELASAVSTHTPVRRAMVERQQQIVKNGGVILEGRDATTVIAPQAELKIYMTASLEERASRRLREFADKGLDSDFSSVRKQIATRDHRDISREDSPLSVAEGAVQIETAGLTIAEVVSKVVELARDLM